MIEDVVKNRPVEDVVVILGSLMLVYMVWSGERMIRVWLVNLVKGVEGIGSQLTEMRVELGELLRELREGGKR